MARPHAFIPTLLTEARYWVDALQALPQITAFLEQGHVGRAELIQLRHPSTNPIVRATPRHARFSKAQRDLVGSGRCTRQVRAATPPHHAGTRRRFFGKLIDEGKPSSRTKRNLQLESAGRTPLRAARCGETTDG